MLWLREAYGVDISCVQLVPYRVDDRVLLASSVLIPLPEASEYTVKRERKRQQAQEDEVERYQVRRKFWVGLLAKAHELGTSHGNLSPSRYHWIGAGSGVRGLGFNYVIWQHGAAAELYIDRGDRDANKAIFDELMAQQAEIESTFGGELAWDRLDAKRAARIRSPMLDAGWRDAEEWEDIQTRMIDLMQRLEAALRPRIAELEL